MNVEFGKCPMMVRLKEETLAESGSDGNSSEEGIIMGNLYEGQHKVDGKHLPFMSIPHTISIENVVRKLRQDWKIHPPKVVLLVISGSEDIQPKQHNVTPLKSLFIKGLIDALKTTEIWVCMDGINQGFSKEFGLAYEVEMFRRKMLISSINEEQTLYFPETAIIGICNQDKLKIDPKLNLTDFKEDAENKRDVNKNLNYFIFVQDQGKQNKGLHNFTLNFIRHLRHEIQAKVENGCQAFEIPLISVFFQGNINQIDLVLDLLKNKFPLLVIAGAGGLADLLSFAYEQTIQRPEGINEAEYTEAIVKSQIMRQISRSYPNLTELNTTDKEVCAKLITCVRYAQQEDREFITTMTLQDLNVETENSSTFFLKASFRSWMRSRHKDFKCREDDLLLAIDWNYPEVTKMGSFGIKGSSKLYVDRELFFRILTKPQREGFVDLFLNQGFLVHKFLNSDTLLNLFRNSLNRGFFKTIIWETIFGLNSDSDITRYFINNELAKLFEKLTSITNFIDTYTLDHNAIGIYDFHTPEQAEGKALILLTIWSVFSYKINIVKTIWKYSDQPVHLALICSVILHKLQNYVSDLNLKQDMENEAKEFNLMATSLISRCYDANPRRAFDLLFEKWHVWSFKPLLEMASFAKNRPLIATTCCQRYLDNQFMGKISVRDLPYGDITIPLWLKVILSAFLVFPTNLWMTFNVPFKHTHYSAENLQFSKKNESGKSNLQNGNLDSITNVFPENVTDKKISLIGKFYYLYTAPITKFWVSQVFYLAYLFLFSLAVLWPKCGNFYLDITVCAWTGVIITDSIYQVITLPKSNPSISLKLKYIEIIGMAIFLLFYIMNRIVSSRAFLSPYSVKVMLCVALLYFYYRIIFQSFTISPDLGPMLYKIKRMTLVDFFGFMRVAALIMFSNGVVIHAIIYPDYPLTKELFRRVIYDAVITLFLTRADHYGVPDLSCVILKRDPNGLSFYGLPKDVCKVGRYYRPDCPNPGVWPYIFGLQYLIFLKLVLLTLLVALFSNTEARLDAEGKYIWKYQRYQLVTDFSNRATFPAPLSLISYCAMLLKYMSCLFCKNKRKGCTEKVQEKDVMYWKMLASAYSTDKANREDNENSIKNRMEKIMALKECLRKQNRAMKNWQRHLIDLQIQKRNTNKILQSSKLQISLSERLRTKYFPQLYSRISPYPGTNIPRFPVSDKHVSWSCDWRRYDPIAYTMPKDDFPSNLQSHVDVDIQRKRETERDNFIMPVFHWNVSSVSPGGVSLNRKSWNLDKDGNDFIYELDSERLPKNSFGRTGLRGRGSLPHWGPNHCIYVIITRWHKLESISYHQYLEVVIMMTEEEMSLPGGYITTEHMYSTVKELFNTKEQWLTEVDMVTFFHSMSGNDSDSNEMISNKGPSTNPISHSKEMKANENVRFTAEIIRRGYLDEALNTDQAWCEATVWHMHYNSLCNLEEYFKPNLLWVVLNEGMLEKVPPGQAFILYSVAKNMKASLEVM